MINDEPTDMGHEDCCICEEARQLPFKKAKELLRAAHTFMSYHVPVDEALINGFDVNTWAVEVEKILAT